MPFLTLYIPKLEDLTFRQELLQDPATMAYNRAWFPPDGCIDFPTSEWPDWYAYWVDQEPDRFYAYLQKVDDGTFVGEVNFHYASSTNTWEIGIVILASERGKGYAKEGMALLLDRAFRQDAIPELSNSFETEREAAWHLHQRFGFKEVAVVDGIRQVRLSRKDYLASLM